jgi:hypothetical protein
MDFVSNAKTFPDGISLQPEWLRLKLATILFGISRSQLYELIGERKIKSISLRKRGKLKGIRLINADSLRDYLERKVEL